LAQRGNNASSSPGNNGGKKSSSLRPFLKRAFNFQRAMKGFRELSTIFEGSREDSTSVSTSDHGRRRSSRWSWARSEDSARVVPLAEEFVTVEGRRPSGEQRSHGGGERLEPPVMMQPYRSEMVTASSEDMFGEKAGLV
jgi:hypothetical protein